jgi:hypothetical protein
MGIPSSVEGPPKTGAALEYARAVHARASTDRRRRLSHHRRSLTLLRERLPTW